MALQIGANRVGMRGKSVSSSPGLKLSGAKAVSWMPEQLTLILLMLVDVHLLAQQGWLAGYAVRDPGQMRRELGRLFEAMNTLHETFDVPPSHGEAMTEAVAKALGLPG